MSIHVAKPSHRYALKQILGGYVVTDPDGGHASRLIRFRPEADQLRAKLQRKADAKAKRGPRSCLCCGKSFDSDGIHNRLCGSCRSQSDALGDIAGPTYSYATRKAPK